MEILSCRDPKFREYGAVWDDIPGDIVDSLVDAVENNVEMPEGLAYTPEIAPIHEATGVGELARTLVGGLDVQVGAVAGHNTYLNSLEYHRTSEFNMPVSTDCVMLFGHQWDIVDGVFDTSNVVAFRVPARTMVEIYATTLHYAPIDIAGAGYKIAVILPKGVNTEKPSLDVECGDSGLLFGCSKYVLAHPESPDAAEGARVALKGENYRLVLSE
ncbi:MAG: DUF4867 family protein [Olsenella sp.]|nr:DUF4867 family protein [Olsenella sp.]